MALVKVTKGLGLQAVHGRSATPKSSSSYPSLVIRPHFASAKPKAQPPSVPKPKAEPPMEARLLIVPLAPNEAPLSRVCLRFFRSNKVGAVPGWGADHIRNFHRKAFLALTAPVIENALKFCVVILFS